MSLVEVILITQMPSIIIMYYTSLVQFRSKNKYLQSITTWLALNMGLLQTNITYLAWKNVSIYNGLSYHWLLDLFDCLKLPIFDGMAIG